MTSSQPLAAGRDPSLEALEALVREAAGRREPQWLQALRRERLLGFAELPVSFGRYSRMKLDWPSLPPRPPALGGRPVPVSGLQALGGEGVPGSLAPLSKAAEALGEGGLRAFFPRTTQWEDFVLAGWSEGALLSWKGGEKGSGPAYLGIGNPGGLVLEPLLLDVGEDAEVSLLLHWDGAGDPAFHVSALSARVARGASLKLFLLHEGDGSHHHMDLRFDVGRDASVELFSAWVGGKWSVGRIHADLPLAGGKWGESHVVLTNGREHLDLDTQVRHLAPRTESDVQVRTVADGSSRAVFTGNILMEPEAENGQAFLSDHVLLLSPGARADSIPGLEIRAQEVRASHQASVSPVDEDQMFYLQSRGLDPGSARHLVVVGFLESLFARASLPLISEVLDPILEERVSR